MDSALNAIQAGNARAARAQLEAQVSAGTREPSLFLVLAHACRAQADLVATERAVDEALLLDPSSLNGLVIKGDLLRNRNDLPAAAGYYDRVLQLIEASGSPQEMQALADYARQWQQQCTTAMSTHLLSHLQGHGYDPSSAPPRFNHALDLLTGKRNIYHQKPKAFYFPELPQRQFYEREEFDWVADLEDVADEIAWELQEVLKTQEQEFTPYLRLDLRQAGMDPNKVKQGEGWRAFYLWQNGQVVLDHAIRCPRTMAALEQTPLTKIRSHAPSVLFSMLRPGARILPHTGFINARLICHLPLIVPADCGLRVGNETRQWEPGKLLIFDDTIEHEAWNLSDQTRVVLLFDIWRPELNAEERRLVASLLEGVDSFTGAPQQWQD